jgi:hypothetical protein
MQGASVRCPQCSNDNPDEFAFCIECGVYLPEAEPPQPPRGHHPGPAPGPPARPPFDQPQPAWSAPPPAIEPARPRPAPARAADGPARLVVIQGAVGQSTIDLTAPALTIGRSRTNDVVLEDTKVSRQHARISRKGDGFVIEDLGSRNGTRVDDRTLDAPCPLEDGAVIRIGDASFRFSWPGRAEPAPAPPADEWAELPPTPRAGRPAAAPRAGFSEPEPAPRPGSVPVVFAAPWSPIHCPTCRGVGTMRPIVYGPAARTTAAQEAAQRGEVFLGGPGVGSDGPNARCTACDTQVRIVPTAPE